MTTWKEEVFIMKIAIGNDHAAVEMKNEIKAYLESKGHEVINFGIDTVTSCNYPEYGKAVGVAVASGEADCGVLICGTGIGISLAANKVKGIRASHCTDTYSARMTVQHNNSNILCLGERVTGTGLALDIVDAWLNAKFEGGRHQKRIDLIEEI